MATDNLGENKTWYKQKSPQQRLPQNHSQNPQNTKPHQENKLKAFLRVQI